MLRRDFVQKTALAGSFLILSPGELYKIKARHIGVQMWSVRDFADKDPLSTLARLADMGYKEIEGHKYADGKFYHWTPRDYKKQLRAFGLKMPSAHTAVNLKSWDDKTKSLTDAMKKCIDSHADVGVRQLICPYIDKEYRSAEDVKKLAEILNHIGVASKKAGMQFGYHNHEFEFVKADGEYLMDIILKRTDPEMVIWEMDLYWVAFANEDPIAWINKYPGRIEAFHVKDMAKTSARETIEVGDGVIDFAKIFTHSKVAGVKYYIVELEHYKTTSLEGVEKSLKNLKGILGVRT